MRVTEIGLCQSCHAARPAWDTLRRLKQLADGVWHLNTFFLPNAINAYLVDDVLVDSGTRQSGAKILKQLQGHKVNAHALTHAHPDHQGSSHEAL